MASDPVVEKNLAKLDAVMRKTKASWLHLFIPNVSSVSLAPCGTAPSEDSEDFLCAPLGLAQVFVAPVDRRILRSKAVVKAWPSLAVKSSPCLLPGQVLADAAARPAAAQRGPCFTGS